MSKNFDFESKKYIILLVIICLLFTVLIFKAFDYLPDENIEKVKLPQEEEIIEKENKSNPENNVQQEEEKTTENTNADKKSGVLYKSNDYEINSMFEEEIEIPKSPLDEDTADVSEDSQNKLSPAEIALKSIINARKYANAEDYTNAINEYQKAAKATSDKDIRAEIFDGITILYLKNKNYKTALSFAEKANELSPSFTREFVIAKIYYESGRTGDAINRINKILKSK